MYHRLLVPLIIRKAEYSHLSSLTHWRKDVCATPWRFKYCKMHTRPPAGQGASATMLSDKNDGDPILNVVFVTPQIPTNVGGMGRTCIGLGARFHLIGPLGFDLNNKGVKRSGLDYWEHVDLHYYDSWQEFLKVVGDNDSLYFFTRFGEISALDCEFYKQKQKIFLLFGSENTGFPEEVEKFSFDKTDNSQIYRVGLPMLQQDIIRCYNVSHSATMVLYDAYKQIVMSKTT
eukprot:m.45156 g.45156  ORF g.45156 m.45156 type:complete len:231 (-) comp10200_c0_seq3:49-741(-)